MELDCGFEFALELIGGSFEYDLEGVIDPLCFDVDDVNKAREELEYFGYESAEDLSDLLEMKEDEKEAAAEDPDDQEWLAQVKVEIAMIKAVIKTK